MIHVKKQFYAGILTLAAVCTSLHTTAPSLDTTQGTTGSAAKLSPYAQALAKKAAAATQAKQLKQLLKNIPKDPQMGIDEARRLLREEIRPIENALIEPLEFVAENRAEWLQDALKITPIPPGWAGESVRRNILKEFPKYAKKELEERTNLATKLTDLRTRLSSLFAAIAATDAKPLYRNYKQLSSDQGKELECLQAAANIPE